MEKEAEENCVETIRKYNVGYDIDRVIQKCNSYVYFYSIIKETAKWYSHPPTKISQILDLMPTTFLKDYTVSEDLLKLYKKYCF